MYTIEELFLIKYSLMDSLKNIKNDMVQCIRASEQSDIDKYIRIEYNNNKNLLIKTENLIKYKDAKGLEKIK